MKYDDEAEWFGDSEPQGSEDGDEDEEAAQFLKLRKVSGLCLSGKERESLLTRAASRRTSKS